MTITSESYTWSIASLVECYNIIKFQDQVPVQLIKQLQNDLINILIVPAKNDASRNKLSFGQQEQNETFKLVSLPNDGDVKLNKIFIENAAILSSQLNLDELHTCELLSNASDIRFSKGIEFLDSGKLLFFQRFDYILNILGYLISTNQLDILTSNYKSVLDNILASFSKIYELFGLINDVIDKQKITSDINNLAFVNSIVYMKNQLFTNHELLGTILSTFVVNYSSQLNSIESFNQILNHLNQNLSDDDMFINYYLPSLFYIVNNLHELSEAEVDTLYKSVTKTLKTDYSKIRDPEDEIDLSKSSLKGVEIVVHLTFLVNFISWCKELDTRTAKYDFKEDILKYIDMTVNYGVMEKLLCITAETANASTSKLLEWSNLYDFRSLLQKVFPRLTPVKLTYPDSKELLNAYKSKPELQNIPKLCSTTSYKVSENFSNDLLAPFFHELFSKFINNAAIILTSLRNNEEDFLLSSINRKQLEEEELHNKRNNGSDDSASEESDSNMGDDYDSFTNNLDKLSSSSEAKGGTTKSDSLDLDEISMRSDLERFYLAFVYTYNDRPELCASFWENEDIGNELIGFITWGLSNNTSPLITSTFCLLLGSLTSGGEDITSKIWEILVHNSSSSLKKNDYSKISIDSILDSLNYYVNSLVENFESDLINQMKQQQKRQEFIFSSTFNGKNDTENSGTEKIVIELAEDSIVFISGFIQLISSIVKRLSSNDPRAQEIKNIAFNRFRPVINGFLRFDNLIMSNKNIQVNQVSNGITSNGNNSNPSVKIDSPNIIIDEENRTVLINLLLNFLSDFIENDDNLNLRFKVWELVDRWLCQSLSEEVSSQQQPTNNVKIAFSDFGTTSHELNGGRGISSSAIVNTSSSRLKYHTRRIKITQGFQLNLTQLSTVGNFVKLLDNLLTPLHNENVAFKNYELLYPPDLGANYRLNNQIGIWPYIEYLLLEVFAKSIDLKDDFESRYNLQSSILKIIKHSLKEVDWTFVNDIAPSVIPDLIKLDNIVENYGNNVNYNLFVKLHHSMAVLNYLFDEKAYKALFDILSIGNEQINENPVLSKLVFDALSIVDEVLSVQNTFISRLLPTLKNRDISQAADNTSSNNNRPMGFGTNMSLALAAPKTAYDNIYYHKALGTKGVTDFYEVMLFNLATIAHFAMYVSNDLDFIADLSVRILTKISKSSFFNARLKNSSVDPLLGKNRLLTVFETIDESVKIKYAFIEQLGNLEGNLTVKLNILNFLSANLSNIEKPTVAHFLLGYEIKGGNLRLPSGGQSLLRCLLKLLEYSLDALSEIDYNNGYKHIVDVRPAKLSSAILEVIISLCRDPISSNITLAYLRNLKDFDLFTKLVKSQPKVDTTTIWYESVFDGDLIDESEEEAKDENSFLINDLNQQSLFAFINQRNSVLQYLSLELHNVESLSKKQYYIDLLLNGDEFLNGSPKILNFLDILNYQFYNFNTFKIVDYAKRYDLESILSYFKQERLGEDKLEDEGSHSNQDGSHKWANSILGKIYKIICATDAHNLVTKEDRINYTHNLIKQGTDLEEFFNRYLASQRLAASQLSVLHSWVQVIQVLISGNATVGVSGTQKCDFILEILQNILPKINDYFDRDDTHVSFAEELVSLCVLLFDAYELENSNLVSKATEHQQHSGLYLTKLMPMFQTCINGIMSSNSTPNLRSDLYVLSNKFLQKNFGSDSLIKQIMIVFKSFDKKFIDIICNDSIYSEGAPRITSIIFLESLIHVSASSKDNFILELIIKNNALSLLVRSIKRTDEMLQVCQSETSSSGIDATTLLYELTAFKGTLILLMRIAQTRQGASQLIQNEIFPILKTLRFLQVDPDLGLALKVDDGNGAATNRGRDDDVSVTLSLDIPLTLNSGGIDASSHNTISYYEFLVPVFQLVVAVVLSMGPQYKPSMVQVKELLHHFNRLIVGVVKRDILIEKKELQSEWYDKDTVSRDGLQELVKLFTLLDSLVN